MAFFARTLVEGFRSTLRREPGCLGFSEPQRPAGIAAPIPPVRLSERDQWQKVSGVISTSIDLARSAKHCQIEAGRQLDSASYSLQKLLEELAPAMVLTRPAAAPVITMSLAPTFRRRTAVAA